MDKCVYKWLKNYVPQMLINVLWNVYITASQFLQKKFKKLWFFRNNQFKFPGLHFFRILGHSVVLMYYAWWIIITLGLFKRFWKISHFFIWPISTCLAFRHYFSWMKILKNEYKTRARRYRQAGRQTFRWHRLAT